MTTVNKLLKYAIPAQREFKKFYEDDDMGLISLDSDYIQVTEQAFKKIADEYKDEQEYTITKKGTWYEATIYIDGTRIITVGSKTELKEVGLL